MRKKFSLYLLVLALLFLFWEGISQTSSRLLFILPPPSAIFSTLIEMRQRLVFHTLFTFKEMCGGFLLALVAAFPLAWAMLRYQTSRTLLQPFFIVIQCLPMFTLAPIMVIWFGWSYTAIVIPTALMIFFPLTLNIYQGLKATPQELLDFFQANQATSWQTLFKLRLPYAVPHVFAGFRISAAIAGVGAVAGEWAGAQNGLGILMLESRRNSDLEITFAALFCLTLITTLLYGSILYFESIALPPRRPVFTWKIFALNPKKMGKKRYVLPILLAAFLVLFSGCKHEDQTTMRLLLDWLPNPNHVPLYAGIEQGFFEEEGIHLIIQKMHDNGGGISYLTSGKADLFLSHLPSTFQACSRGAGLKLVGVLINEPLRGLIYHRDSTIQHTADLTGKVLGYCIGGPDTTFLDFLLKRGEISPIEKKNVSVDLISAMGTHSVDFIYGGFWNIEPFQLKSLGIETETFKIQELGIPPYYELIVLGRGDLQIDFVQSFQRALQKSLNFSREFPHEAFACYVHANPDKRAKTLEWEEEAWNATSPLLAKSQNVELELVDTFYSWQLEQGILPHPFEWKKLVLN